MSPSSRRSPAPGTLRVLPGGRAHPGLWREGDPVGRRQFVDVGPVDLETGGHLPAVRVAYETWGTLAADRSNAVLVEHALTGDSHVAGPAQAGHPSPGWWDWAIGPGRAIDTDRWFVVATNVLGGCQGSTGPSSAAPDGRPWGSRFPYVTVRDQVAVEAAVADALGIDAWALVIGGSMGGMRALEWAISRPERVRAVAPLATAALSTGDQIAWAHAQLAAIRSDPAWHGGDYYDVADGRGPVAGMGVARQIAHATYRSAVELDTRFGRRAQDGEQPLGGGGRFAVQSYLDHHAGKLARRFDPGSYVALTEAILSHDVGRGRGGVTAALGRVTARPLVLGVDSDRLYLPEHSVEIAAALPGAPEPVIVSSDHGHDGFLIEADQVAPHIRGLLDEV
ncbi:homoserine O-acetyltransferase [Isoptericola sp. b441]|uniref:Homoserine O-acetyltransferase n=1 Tax=Actinotalea lenta TaxID=3064654 RepID=A0ABT9D6W1_9CELL|nr:MULTISPECIES: homoserine O-acetyltransferase [unclassified Isoptericola]MDO8106577.1 homoserine O-acetyltransferase [Isoptericola sp. b441]MDO8121715.1 homoserine O-acetyltransferase [Isoptericola sp. b490]